MSLARGLFRSSAFRAPSRVLAISAQLQTASPSSSSLTFTTYRTMSSIPTTMKGVIIEQNGGTEVLQHKTDLPVPEPKDGEVLVKNDFVGVNFIDTYFRTGLYKPPGFPYTLGREAEGTVVKTAGAGELHGLAAGDKVCWMAEGAYSEYTAVPASKVIKLPDAMPPQVAAAGLLQGLTALTLVREAYAVQKGDWILVHAAAGGTGLWLCQLLRAIGAQVIGTASTPEKVALASKAGATYMVNYSHEDVKAKVDELTGGAGVRAVFDGVGKSTFDLSLDCLARKGSMISFGNASGAVPPFTIARLAAKNIRLMRPQLFGFVATREELEMYTADLFGFITRGEVDVRVHEVYPLSEVARAHGDLEGRKTTGKLLVDPSK